MWILWLACNGSEKIDSGTPQSQCIFESEEAFELFPTFPTTQIHADVAFDGSNIWTVFNIPNSDGDFDVYISSMDCAGSIIQEPTHIVQLSGVNQTTPRIAISQNSILVAVQGDNGNGATNLSIQLYVQELNGTVLLNEPWTPSEIPLGNRWLPTVVGTDNGFWIAGAVANSTHFRTLVQRLDLSGQPANNAHWVGEDSYAVFPNIDGNDLEYVVGWETGNDSVGWLTGGMDGPNNDLTIYDGSSGTKVVWNDGDPQVFTHRVSPLSVLWNDSQLSELGGTHNPNVAAGMNSSLVMYYHLQSGYSNDVITTSIINGNTSSLDNFIHSDPPAAPYRPAITHLVDDKYFLTWSQGTSPDFFLAGQFVDLQE